MPKRKPIDKNHVRRQSSRKICVPIKYEAEPAKRENNYFSLVQKQSLLKALTLLSNQDQSLRSLGPKQWTILQKHVKTKPVEKIKCYVESVMQSISNDSNSGSDPKTSTPLQEWVELFEDQKEASGLDCTTDMSKMLSTASRECRGNPSSGPDYKRLYQFMDALFQGKDLPELSNIDALVILDCIKNLESFINEVDTSKQKDFMIEKSNKLKEFLYSNKDFIVTTEMCDEIALHDNNKLKDGQSLKKKKKVTALSLDSAGANTSQTDTNDVKNRITLSMSSLNPIGITKKLLDFKKDDRTDDDEIS